MFQSKTAARLLGAVGAALLAVLLLAPMAQAREPAPGLTQFAGCPSPEENANIFVCVFSEVTGGHFQVGNKNVPIEKKFTLGGGLNEEFAGFASSPKGGLSKAKQEVPGGVVGLTGLTELLGLFGVEALKLYAETELAGVPTNFTFGTVTIPIKVHLTNPAGIIGNNCYDGSKSNPIVLNFTTHTTSPPPPNKPITGKEPEFSETATEVIGKNGIYVDNAFAAPGVTGCSLYGLIPINGLVNVQSGLPAAAGTNEAVQNFNLELSPRELVYP